MVPYFRYVLFIHMETKTYNGVGPVVLFSVPYNYISRTAVQKFEGLA